MGIRGLVPHCPSGVVAMCSAGAARHASCLLAPVSSSARLSPFPPPPSPSTHTSCFRLQEEGKRQTLNLIKLWGLLGPREPTASGRLFMPQGLHGC